MDEDLDIKLLMAVLSDLAVPGGTYHELIILALVVLFMVWRRKK